ncbi:hypothetical protein VP01_1220g5 [Puccinia sorghi]|uniref:Uncharacterized protein n=1 Tax=Puccinia sorghi TaxID=27349 RepID=A0A0L6VQ66_9BASI|nr:hypothetical protein VP01_1220g5 [Puccinia sorghi]
MFHNQPKGKRPETPGKPSMFGTKALASALCVKGRKPPSSQMAEKGSNCNFCRCAGHWASTCNKLSSDLQSGKLYISQLTAKAVLSGPSNQRPTQVWVQAVDMSKPHSDTILIDSGASACVSGNSVFFCLECTLTKPIPVLLTSRKPSLFLTSIL